MNHQYSRRLEKIEAVLRAYLPETPDADWGESVFSLPREMLLPELMMPLTMPGSDLVQRGGKRWRPLLMTLVCETMGGGERSLPLTPLVEFPHNASLIHDDIEDNSDERRGQPATHIRYGIDTAINSGAFLYFLPLACVRDWDAALEQKDMVYQLWGESMRRLHFGQSMDITWHRDSACIPSLEQYDLMCRLKTGSLAWLAVALGLVTALALSEKRTLLIKKWGQAAEKLGMGFQILDDVKNLTTGNLGKRRGDDVVEGKKSLPVLLYLHERPERGEWFSTCFAEARKVGVDAPLVNELIAELAVSGVLAKAEARGRALINEAREAFSDIPSNSGEMRGELSKLFDFIGGTYA
ncbi:MAG: polyprenyl synthetase family protein [Treponema sp.]|jgi:octaprenyl-diphosphate synthase|nr:polyprenyl synthetase family protein [Treponema sp.]